MSGSGALTKAELQAIWAGAADPGYTQPLVEAGEGNGFEAWTQFFEQLARASKAIDVTTQAMFISPWSGQTNPPAGGAQRSQVILEFSRTKRLQHALLLGKGAILVQEKTTLPGEEGPVEFLTGRRYVLREDVLFFPGDSGPLEVLAEAEREGYGYDNPRPETLSAIFQPGAVFENDVARVDVSTQPAAKTPPHAGASVTADDQADMFIPDHVGQYFEFTAGLNSGLVVRARTFYSPRPDELLGSAVDIDLIWTFSCTSGTGPMEVGELVEIRNGGTPVAYGQAIASRTRDSKLLVGIRLLSGGSIVVGRTLEGLTSGNTATIETILSRTEPVAEAPVAGVGGAAWRFLDWVEEWGLTVTNAVAPAGGRAAMLDELGNERGVWRGPNEGDDQFRVRVREIADVVSPNAIIRTVRRSFTSPLVIAPLFNLREAGTSWPGIFFDGTNEPPEVTPHGAPNDAYDTATYVYTGTLSSGAFRFQEPVVVEDSLFRKVAEGFVGSYTPTQLVLVYKAGRPLAGGTYRVRGLWSDARFATTSVMVPNAFADRRYRTWLDYEQFRAFFWIEVQPLGLGEFGFAYDVGDANAYDVGFYDGFPRLVGDLYLNVYKAVDRARAGGVGFEMRRIP